jgi:3-dehydroquinate synthase
MAEAVKVALIRDAASSSGLRSTPGRLAASRHGGAHLIRRCAELHMRQIALGGDPFESGSARPLDFGHWSAHKLEMLTGHALSHGEAVAIGIALDARYSVLAGMLAKERMCASAACCAGSASPSGIPALRLPPRTDRSRCCRACASSASISAAN